MSEHSSTLAVLLKRLEVATSRIEELALSKTKTAKVTQNAPPTSAPVTQVEEEPSFIQGYETMVVPSIEKYLDLSAQVGDVVLEQSNVVKELLLNHQRKFLLIASKAKKPADQEQLNKFFHPSQAAIEGLIKHVEDNRPSPLFNHLSTVSSGIPAVSWVIVEPETATCVKELTDSSQFYAYRVIKAFKEGDRTHVDWANAFVQMLNQLHAYVLHYHKTGLSWNPKGQDIDSLGENVTKQSLGSPRPPPPPKPATLRTAAEPVNPSSMFSELNKGDAITSGLKRVDKSQMTHKNPRRDGETSVTPPARSTARPSHKTGKDTESSPKPAKEPEVTLDGHKWLVQHHTTGNVVIEPTELKQIVYIYNCNSTTIQIKGKCNGVVLDSSKKSGVVLDTAMASVDIINCQSCQVQIMQSTPTLVVDKTDGLQLYLSNDCLNVEILTAKSSQINVLLPSGEDDFAEKAIPEQFKTTIIDGKVVTTPMEHE